MKWIKATLFMTSALLLSSHFANSQTTVILDLDTTHLTTHSWDSVIWNSVNQGFHRHIYINLKETSSRHLLELDTLTWGPYSLLESFFDDHFVQFVGSAPLILNKNDGFIYMGDERIGHWHGHPNQKGFHSDGFSFTVPIEIDEIANTLTIQ